MPRDRLATVAIIVCMVAAVSTLPALLIAGSLPQPVVHNYYTTNTTTTTNNTVYVNATYPNRIPHFMNVSTTIPTSVSGAVKTTIATIPLVNRTTLTVIMTRSYDRRAPGGNSGFTVWGYLFDVTIFSTSGYTTTDNPVYTYLNLGTAAAAGWSYPNGTGYVLNVVASSPDTTFTDISIDVAIWWETW